MASGELGQSQAATASMRQRLEMMLNVVRGSLDPRRWLIGGLAALLVAAGGSVLDAWSGSEPATQWPWQVQMGGLESGPRAASLLETAGEKAVDMAWNPELLGRPLRDVMTPVVQIVSQRGSWSETAIAWSRFLVAVVVWSLGGVMLVRMTASDVARGESLTLAEVSGFGLRHIASLLSAVLISLLWFGVLWGLCILGGLFAKIPTVGPLVVSLLWFIPLVLGLLMAFVSIGFVAGWPLMVATIGVEDSDGFDGFSHAHGFLTDRPALLAGQAMVGTVVGSLAIGLAGIVLAMTLWLAGSSVAVGLDSLTERSGDVQPAVSVPDSTSGVGVGEVPVGLMVSDTAGSGDASDVPFSSTFLVFWVCVAKTLFVGYAASVFWGIVTGLYLIVRDSADGIPMTQMWLRSDDVDSEDQPNDHQEAGDAEVEPDSGAST
jgi:hypothetical protein